MALAHLAKVFSKTSKESRVNIVPRLLQDPSWATIASFSTNELIELIMLTVMSVGLIAAACYGIYRGLRHQD